MENSEKIINNTDDILEIRKLTKDELIQLSIKLWQPLFNNKRFKKGKAVVFIKEPKFKTLSLVIHSGKPIVRSLTIFDGEDLNKICDDIVEIYKKQEFYTIMCGKRDIKKQINSKKFLNLSIMNV